MPKKRKTRVVGSQALRPKATLPEGDEGQDLSAEDREAKLAVMITDFEDEVQTRIKNLRNIGKNLAGKIRSAYTIELMQIPKHVREMKVSEYLKYVATKDGISDEDGENFEKIDAKLNSAVKMRNERLPLQPVNEEIEGMKTGKTMAAKRGRLVQSRNIKVAPMLPPSTTTGGRTIRKTRQKMFETPSQHYQPSRPGWETPLVTPKFDPRLPITPACGRQPKPNERIMSMTGSPIYVGGAQRGERKEQFQILTAIREVDFNELKDNMDEQTMHSLEELHKKLSKFIKS